MMASLAKLGEETPRPDTAPSGSRNDVDGNRRSAQIMHDFFKETTLREKLQEQYDDLNREVENLHYKKEKLKKQLLEAQAAIADKDRAFAGDSASVRSDHTAQTTLVDEMERKFARETEQLEEQSQKLEVEKQAETAMNAKLEQVLNDLQVELERQGREWDAEKKELVKQRSQIANLTKEVATLKDERDALSKELDSAKTTLDELQTKLDHVQQTVRRAERAE
jgi:chromosome segregation ATPase